MPVAPFLQAVISAVSPMRLRESTAAPAASAAFTEASSPLRAAAINCWFVPISPSARLTPEWDPSQPASRTTLARTLVVVFMCTSKCAAPSITTRPPALLQVGCIGAQVHDVFIRQALRYARHVACVVGPPALAEILQLLDDVLVVLTG